MLGLNVTKHQLFFLIILSTATIFFFYLMSRFASKYNVSEVPSYKHIYKKPNLYQQFPLSEIKNSTLSPQSVEQNISVSGLGNETKKSDNNRFNWAGLKNHTVLPGVFAFQNVCIEPLKQPIVRKLNFFTGSTLTFNETQRIVVYNSNVSVKAGWKRFYTSFTKNTIWNHWDIHFSNSYIPSTRAIQNNTAFFLLETFPGNFHHFWTDEFLALYWTIKSTNQLKLGNHNQLLYRIPTCFPVNENNKCSYYRNYEVMLKTLYIENFHEAFFRMTPNTCFSAAVFGTTTKYLNNKKEAIDHVLHGFGLPVVSLSEAKYITFINRSRRVIVNLDELVNVTREFGLEEVIVVKLEELSIEAQARIISNSRVLIGVQGAGLQWAMFMPLGSYMIEIAWPKKHWKFFFIDIMRSYGVQAIGIETNDVAVNWDNYEKATRKGIRILDAERERLIQNPPTESHNNPYKYADCRVNKVQFIEKFNLIKREMMIAKV